MMHDAVLAEATAIRLDDRSSVDQAVNDPSTVANFVLRLRCGNTVPGASGFIAIDPGSQNPIDKAIPIIRIAADGTNAVQDISWPAGAQIDYSKDTC